MPLPVALVATNTMPPPEAEHAPELRLMRIRLLLVVGATFVLALFIGAALLALGVPGLGPLLAKLLGAAPGAAVIGLPVVFVLTIALVAWMARAVIRPAEQLASSRRDLGTLYESARSRALEDSLTGLANHRAFQEEFESLLALGARHRMELALLLNDVDDFKTVNDSAGHAVGDDLLVEMGRILRSQLRASDRPFRIGGDEFAILLPHTDAENAKLVANRLLAPAGHGPRPALDRPRRPGGGRHGGGRGGRRDRGGRLGRGPGGHDHARDRRVRAPRGAPAGGQEVRVASVHPHPRRPARSDPRGLSVTHERECCPPGPAADTLSPTNGGAADLAPTPLPAVAGSCGAFHLAREPRRRRARGRHDLSHRAPALTPFVFDTTRPPRHAALTSRPRAMAAAAERRRVDDSRVDEVVKPAILREPSQARRTKPEPPVGPPRSAGSPPRRRPRDERWPPRERAARRAPVRFRPGVASACTPLPSWPSGPY